MTLLETLLRAKGFSDLEIAEIVRDHQERFPPSKTLAELWAQWHATHVRDTREFLQERNLFTLLSEPRRKLLMDLVAEFDNRQSTLVFPAT